jgi:hypothetical protein
LPGEARLADVTPLIHTQCMGANESNRSVNDLPDDVVELWFCPVCDAPAHRTRRPGRPKLYCSNACRQRAYRWRRDHHARLVARPCHPAAGAFVPFGRWHALRSDRDFVGRESDLRNRFPTICGAFARPARLMKQRTHHQFVPVGTDACRSCAALVAPPLDPLAPAVVPPPPRHRDELVDDRIAYIERLDPTHPIRRHPERYGLLTEHWMRTRHLISRRTNDPPG